MIERTLVFIKPDGVRRKLVGEIISRFERLGLDIVAMKSMRVGREMAEEHYVEHRNKPFYRELVDFITSGMIVAMVLEGEAAVEIVRKLMGPTDGREAPPGTIRGDFAVGISENLVHGSDSTESAERELRLFFPELF
jgi:nucleoside-diphosphate kinase